MVGASSLRPQKAVKTRNGADSKEKLSNPRNVFFFFARSSPICSSDSCGAFCRSTPLATSAKRAVAVSPRENWLSLGNLFWETQATERDNQAPPSISVVIT